MAWPTRWTPAADAADADDGADEDEADVLPVQLQAAAPRASPAAKGRQPEAIR